MIIRRVKLAPFGGVANREVVLQPGLNVVLGPNEAGKSTLVSALFAALFLPSGTKKGDAAWKSFIGRYFPHGGGDTVSVLVEFLCKEGKEYTLSRSWGAKKEDKLEMKSGAVVHGEEQIRQILSSVLRHGRGTYEGVLFARQDEMIRTVELLRKNEEASDTLSEILRAVLFETGGVSLEKLEAELAEEKKNLLNLWDMDRDGPKDNKGIDTPWVKGCGEVLKAYYAAERLKRAVQSAITAEKTLDETKARLFALTLEKQRLDEEKAALESVENDVTQRAILLAGLESLRGKEKELKQVNVEWPTAAATLKALENEELQIGFRHEQLQREREEAKRMLAARARRELLNTVRPWAEEAAAVGDELKQMRVVSGADLKWLTEQLGAIRERSAELQAMKLKVRLTAGKPISVQVTTGLGREETVTVQQEAVFDGEGRLRLEHADWVLDVQSGQADVEQLLAALESLRSALREKLQELGVAGAEEARAVWTARSEKENSLGRLQAKISAQLKEIKLEELAAEVAALPPDVPVRETERILADLAQMDADSRSCKEKAKKERDRIAAWVKEYGQHDEVMVRLASVLQELRQSEEKLRGLAPLPAGFAGTEQFLARLRELREKSQNAAQAVYNSKLTLADAEKALPENSAEEMQQQLTVARESLARLKKRAAAVLAVEKKFMQLAENLDANTYTPFADAFARYLAPATGYRYRAASLDGAIPGSIVEAGGGELPVELLSTGTTRGVALALRLAMAEYLLGDAGGFMVMDDPLTDLDPERKRHAAEMIADYAKDRQLIILTCEPETAKLLGGCLTELVG